MNDDHQRDLDRQQEAQREMARQLEAQQAMSRELNRIHELQYESKRAAAAAEFNSVQVCGICGSPSSGGVGQYCASCHAQSEAGNRAAEESREQRLSAHDFAKALPTQLHHFASNKGQKRELYEKVAADHGLDLDGDWNKEALPHRGRHPDVMHAYVLGTMEAIADEAGGDPEIFTRLFEERVRQTIREAPEMLRRRAWYE